VTLREDVPGGHKFCILPIESGENVIKYGLAIGHTTRAILPGEWVHVHNVETNLNENLAYTYEPNITPLKPAPAETFDGYVRADGSVGIRNEIWVLPTVGCVNDVSEHLARLGRIMAADTGVEGVYAFPHPYGCSQMSEDHETTRQLLANLARHPNAGGVLVVGLGCEDNRMASFQELLADMSQDKIRYLVAQDVEDEIEAGEALLAELIHYAGGFQREPVPVSKLVIGMKCGGSDGFSGITANPVVGAFSDLLIAQGGSTILTEVPEMFGAETLLMNRAVNREIFDETVAMVNNFKDYFRSHGQVIYDNPSPGNKDGGITTLEDKSLGCVQKGGTAPVSDVIAYTGRVKTGGLTLLSGPGNDLVSATAQTAAGAHMILFTTGRGTPFGAPAPTVKIATNRGLAQRKAHWIDFDAGVVAEGASIQATAEDLLAMVIEIASGKRHTCTEREGYREIAIFKNGVTV
jgi:altronate hydrolase